MKLPKELTTVTRLSKYLAMVLFITLPFIGFFMGMNYQSMLDLSGRQQADTSLTVIKPSPTPTTNISDTSNWKTYTSSEQKFSFKYPESYTLVSSKTDGILLSKIENQIVKGGGFGGGDVLSKGSAISLQIWPSKDLTEASLQAEFGRDIVLRNTMLDGKNAIEIIFPNNQPLRHVFIPYNGIVLDISINVGFETDQEIASKYLSEFDQILSTFQFTD